MPRHVRKPRPATSEHKALIRKLAEELKNPKDIGQPIILEDSTPKPRSTRVHVIWDCWEEHPAESRSALIEKAYEAAFGRGYREQITLALGLTVPEAASMGLLPFQVTPARRRGEAPSDEEYAKAMLEAGASTLADTKRPQLRFATIEDAQTAYEHLEEALPGSKWIITQEVSPAMD